MSKWLSFEEDDHYEGKTRRMVVVSKKHLNILGEIKWYTNWRQYAFFPEPGTVWNPECMKDIQDEIARLMKQRKLERLEEGAYAIDYT